MENTNNRFTTMRAKSREEVFKSVFSMEFNDEYLPAEVEITDEIKNDEKYIIRTVEGIKDNREKIDEIISASLRGRDIDRLSKQVVAILRLGTYEICIADNIPPVTAISEAVKLGDIYCEENEVSYINGVLNGIYKSFEQNK